VVSKARTSSGKSRTKSKKPPVRRQLPFKDLDPVKIQVARGDEDGLRDLVQDYMRKNGLYADHAFLMMMMIVGQHLGKVAENDFALKEELDALIQVMKKEAHDQFNKRLGKGE
jgi:hypothetical protein